MKLTVLAVTGALACAGIACAEDFPVKPVRMIVGFAPGGSTDLVARVVAQKMSEAWGQQVVVDNRPGAVGNIAAETVANAAPDGYTLFVAASAQLAVNPAVFPKLPFDPVKSFAPVSFVGSVPNMLVANPSLPVRTLKEFIAFAKARPGQLSYASAGSGSTAHLSIELLKLETGIELVHVPYRGSGPATIDLLSGQIQSMMGSPAATLNYVKAGRVRALAQTSIKRSSLIPDIPTLAESGLKDYDVTTWYGFWAPARMPHAVTQKLHAETVRLLALPDTRQLLTTQGLEPLGNTPEEARAFLAAEIKLYGDIVKKIGRASCRERV